MSNIDQDSNDVEITSPSELDVLKERASKLGITYHPAISVDKLRVKVNNKLNLIEEVSDDEDSESTVSKKKAAIKEEVESISERDNRLRKEANRLVRVRVNCMNPNKKEWAGEVLTSGNSVVGTIKKYVPFNNEAGWHVPAILLTMLQERECQIFTTVTDSRGNKMRKGKMIKEFAIEILPPLTGEEIKELATTQAVARSID